jgi:hypothetical protein
MKKKEVWSLQARERGNRMRLVLEDMVYGQGRLAVHKLGLSPGR